MRCAQKTEVVYYPLTFIIRWRDCWWNWHEEEVTLLFYQPSSHYQLMLIEIIIIYCLILSHNIMYNQMFLDWVVVHMTVAHACYVDSFSCREQRVTGTMVFILTGLSVFMAPVLKVWTFIFHKLHLYCLFPYWYLSLE